MEKQSTGKFLRLMIALVSLLMLCFGAVFFTACDTNTDQTGTAVAAHTHVWRPNGDHTDATCSLPGQETLVCTYPGCNATTVAYTPTKAHNWEQVGIVEPNAAMGILEYTYTLVCTDCGQRIALTDAHEHSYGAFTLVRPANSCVEYGWFDRTCTVCGEHEIYAKDPAAIEPQQGFEYKNVTELPEGAKFVAMEGGSAVEHDATEEAIEPFGHTFAEDGVAVWEDFKAPTCTEKGQQRTACTRCGGTQGSAETGNEGYKYRDVEATGHTFPEDPEEGWTITTPAQCNTPGVESRYCTVCGEDETERAKQDKNGKTGIETRSVEALEHDFAGQQWVIDEPATCTTPGSQHMDCKNCNGTIEGGKKTESIEATGHSYPLGLQPGAEYDSQMESEYQSVVPAQGRYVAPTCDKEGYYEFDCEHKCGTPLKLTIPATGHKFKGDITIDSVFEASKLDWYKANADEETFATCTTDGTYVFYCANCDVTVTITEPKLNHAKTTVKEAKDATCTTDGWTRGEICDLCGEVLEKSEEVPAKGHSYAGGQLNANSTYDPAMEEVYKQYEKQDEHVNAECEKEGAYMIYCEHGCGSRIVISIPMTGHDWSGEWIQDTAPTCTAGGTAHKDCANGCGAKLQSNAAVLPQGVEPWDGSLPTGHTWGNWIVDTYTTCLADGAAHLECQNANCDVKMLSTDPMAATYKTEEKGWVEEDMGKAYGSHLYLDTEDEWKTDIEPNCTTGGTQHRNCTRTDRNTELPCDGQETRQVPAKGHDFGGAKRVSDQDFVNGTVDPADLGTPTGHEDANCQHAAYDEYTCSECGKTYKVYDGRIGRHHFIDMWMSEEVDEDGNHYYQEPTCTQPGWADRICSICGETGTRTIPATGHHYSELLGSNAGHYKWNEEEGDYYYEAEVGPNGRPVRVENEKPSYMGHDAWYSCKASLKYYYKCDKCDEICVEDTGVYASHDWENEYTIEANCLHGTIIYFYCYDCGMRSEPVDTGNLGEHKWVEGITIPASCTVAGYKTVRCEVCGTEQISEVLEAPGHQLGEEPVVFPATCTDPEIKEWHCTVCNELIKREVGENLGGHKWVEKSVVPGTCANEGYTIEECTVCGITRKINTEPAKKHMYADEFLDHYYGIIEKLYDGDAHVDYEAAKAMADRWVMEVVYPAMKAMYAEIEAKGTADQIVQWIENQLIEKVDPTCTEMGYTNVACIYCHVVKTTEYTSPLGHMPHEVEAIESTHPCLDGGTLGYFYCERCNLVYKDEGCTIPAIGKDGKQCTTENVIENYAKQEAKGHTYSEFAIPLQVYFSCLGPDDEAQNIIKAKVCLVCFAEKFEELHGEGTDGEITMNGGTHVTLEQLVAFNRNESSWNRFIKTALDGDYDLTDCIVADSTVIPEAEGRNISDETETARPYHHYAVIEPEVGEALTIYIGDAAGHDQTGPAYLPISCTKAGGRLTLVCENCCATEGTLTKADYEAGKYVFFDMQDLWAHAIAKADEEGTYPPTDDKFATGPETELYKAAQKLVIDGFTAEDEETVYDSLGKYINFTDVAAAEEGFVKTEMKWADLYNNYIYNPEDMGHHAKAVVYGTTGGDSPDGCRNGDHAKYKQEPHIHEDCELDKQLTKRINDGKNYAWECEDCGYLQVQVEHTHSIPADQDLPCGVADECTVCHHIIRKATPHQFNGGKLWDYEKYGKDLLTYEAAMALEDANELQTALGSLKCTEALYCEVCGKTLVAPKGHNYSYSAEELRSARIVLFTETCQSFGLMALPCKDCYSTDGLKAATVYNYKGSYDAEGTTFTVEGSNPATGVEIEIVAIPGATDGYNVSDLQLMKGTVGHTFWTFTAKDGGFELTIDMSEGSGYHAPTCFADGKFDDLKCISKGAKVSEYKVNADEWARLLGIGKETITIEDIDLSTLLDADGVDATTTDCNETISDPHDQLVTARNTFYALAGCTTEDDGDTWQDGDESSDDYKKATAIDDFLANKMTKLEHKWISEYSELPAEITIGGVKYTHFEATEGKAQTEGYWLVKAPTCTEAGILVRICTQACCGIEAIGGEHYAEFVHELAKHNHNYPLDELDPDYDGSKVKEGVADPYATEELTETLPTCTEAGTKITICTKCGATIKTEEIEALGHDDLLTMPNLNEEDLGKAETGTYAPHKLFEIGLNVDGRTLKFYLLDGTGERVKIKNQYVPGLATEAVPDEAGMFYLAYVYQGEAGENDLAKVLAMAAKAPRQYAEPDGCAVDEFVVVIPDGKSFKEATKDDALVKFVGGYVWHEGYGEYVCPRCGETQKGAIKVTDWIDKIGWEAGESAFSKDFAEAFWGMEGHTEDGEKCEIKLEGDLDLTQRYVSDRWQVGLPGKVRNVTLDLNGYTLNAAEGNIFVVAPGSELVIKNGDVVVTSQKDDRSAISAVGGKIVFEGVNLKLDAPISVRGGDNGYESNHGSLEIVNSKIEITKGVYAITTNGSEPGVEKISLKGVEIVNNNPGSVGVFFVGSSKNGDVLPELEMENCTINTTQVGVLLRGSVKASIANCDFTVTATEEEVFDCTKGWGSGTKVQAGALVVGNPATTESGAAGNTGYMNNAGTTLTLKGTLALTVDLGEYAETAGQYYTFFAEGYSKEMPVTIDKTASFKSGNVLEGETVKINANVVFAADGKVEATADTVVAALTAGGTVEATENIELSIQDLGKFTEDTTLDLGNNKLTLNTCDSDNSNKTFMVESGNLTIRGGELKTAAKGEEEQFDRTIASIGVHSGATLTLDHVTADLATSILPYDGSTLNILNSELMFGPDCSMGISTNGSYEAPSTVNIIGSKINMTSSGDDDGVCTIGVLLNKHCTALIKDTEITANKAGIVFRTSGTCTVENVKITLIGCLTNKTGTSNFNTVADDHSLPGSWGTGTSVAFGGIVIGDTNPNSSYLEAESKESKLILKGTIEIVVDDADLEETENKKVTYPAIFAVDADGAETETCTCTVDLTECTNASEFGAHVYDGDEVTAKYIVWLVNGAKLVTEKA